MNKKIIVNKSILIYISEFIKNHNFDIIELSDIKNNDIIYICTFNFDDIDKILNKCSKLYIINIEQLSIVLNKQKLKYKNEKRILDYFDKLYKYIYNEKIKIIDYSFENKILWKDIYNINVKTIIEPIYDNVNINFHDKDIDIISLFNCEYRSYIKNKYLNELNIYNFIGQWEQDRRNIFKKAKILINIHASDNYIICETFRINEALKNKIIIISQHCYKNELLDKRIIFCDNDKIKDKCKEILNNYDYYYNLIYS